MDYLYYIEKHKSLLFREHIVDGCNDSSSAYSFDVKRKSDPLLIVFLNSFDEQDFDRRRIPKLFLRLLLCFKESRAVINEWEKGSLTSEFVSWWITSDAWKEDCFELVKDADETTLFFLKCAFDAILSPVLYSLNGTNQARDVIENIMVTDWQAQKVYWSDNHIFPQSIYLNMLHIRMVEYSALWYFIKHQATVNTNNGYGLFPEKKVRYFCRNYLGVHYDLIKTDVFMDAVKYSEGYRGPHYDPTARYPATMSSERKWKQYYVENSLVILKNIRDPQGFCFGFDQEYLDYIRIGDYYQARNLLEIICVSLLHFSIYEVPIRRCTLCGHFYIPIKNPNAELNFCHRVFKKNTKKTCSSFHSHNQKSSVATNTDIPISRFERAVKSFRSSLSQSTLNDYLYGHEWLNFMRDVLVLMNKTVKKDSSQIANCEIVLRQMKALHKELRAVKKCPNFDLGSVDIKNDTLSSIESKLRMAEHLLSPPVAEKLNT